MFHRKWMILFVMTGIFVWLEALSWAVPLESLLPKQDLPEEWARVEGPQTYTKKTLFERINGEAELFFKYGFQQSVFAIYQSKKNRENQVELDIYDMGNVLQAFGVFSRFRNEDRPGGFGLDSSLDDHSAFFYQGRYFVILYAPEPNQEILRQFCKLISLKISDPSPPPREISYFSKNGLKPGSIQYFSEGLLGHQFLKRGFQGTYVEKTEGKAEDKTLKLFLAIFQNSQKAISALRDFKDDLSKQGKVSSGSIIEFETRGLKGEDPYQGKVMVLQKGFYLLGVVGFEKEEDGENRLAEFVKNVK
ncbi:MAG: hypothetical protein A2157_14785 [Deltaproteobacteria bacterium RBG_16_47_11]|nr:MAG: hypothetical protein A2157_14785 [Deltaproteobacteria bacterium RBG_16_47_11]